MAGIKKLIRKEGFDVKDYTIILSNKNHTHLGQLKNITDINYNAPMASAKELSFTVHWSEEPIISEYYDLIINEEIDESVVKSLIQAEKDIWDQIEDLKLVYVKELDEYFEIKVTYTDAADTIKVITGTSACEAELSQLNIYTTEINTEQDIKRENYKPTKFYNEVEHDASLLHRILADKASHYTIAHVDTSLMNLQRSFSIDGTSIYDFLMGECAEQFNCLFVFNSVERSISVYDLYTVCKNDDCGYRGDFTYKIYKNGDKEEFKCQCPKCGGTDVKYFGEDTLIYVDKENLTEEVVFETDVDSIKNCFKLEAGDDTMTAAIRALNQNGTDYIYVVSPEQRRDMSEELVQRLEEYDVAYNSKTNEYRQWLEQEYEAIDKILYYTSEMMPDTNSSQVEINASTEAAKLTRHNLSPLGLSSVTSSTSLSTIESALKNYAKVYVKTGYVKLEIVESNFVYDSANGGGKWTGKFKVTNYSDDEDVAYSDVIDVDIHDNYQEFIEQKILREFASADDEEGSVFNVLAIEDLNTFKNALKEYCLRRLASFYDALQTGLDVLVQVDQASETADLYDVLYLPYYEKLQACQAEIDARSKTITEWEAVEEQALERRMEIQDYLNFEKFLGDLYSEFCVYRREDKYSNTNFISDGYDNAQIFENAQEFLDTAKKELEKSATRQHSISTTLQNLLLIPEFEPLLDKFELGNWIRVGVGDDVYRLRLIRYSVNLSDLSKIEVEFSDLIKTADGASDVKSILDSAQSMSSSYSYVSKQATQGKDAQATIKNWTEEGLNSALINLKNNDTEDITIDRHGILCRSLDEMTESYSTKQARITGNVWAFTKDNWKTVSCALGEHDYVYYDDTKKDFTTQRGYGMSSEFVQSGWVYSSYFIGGRIYSKNYSEAGKTGTIMDLETGSLSFGGGVLTYDATNGLHVEGSGTFTGTIHASVGGEIGGWSIGKTTLVGGKTTLKNDGSLSGDGEYKWSIGSDGTATFNKLIATGGTIGGCSIENGVLKIANANIGEKLTANSIDATNLKVDAANVTGKLTATQIDATNLKVTAANVTGTLTASQINATDLKIAAANVTGKITASQINTSGLIAENISADTITGKTITGCTINCTGATISGKLTAGEGSSLAGFSVDNNSLFSGTWSGNTMPNVFMCTGTSGSYYVGDNLISNLAFGAGGNFGVTKAGALYSSNANINGGDISLYGAYGTAKLKVINSTYTNSRTEIAPAGIDLKSSGSGRSYLDYSGLYVYNSDNSLITRATSTYLSTTGTKNRIINTKHYGAVKLYCYETPSPMFGDIGEGKIDESGICYVFIDDVFSETIDTDISYQVFIQKYGNGDCYITERTSSYFVVKGTPNLSFGWEIKAMQFDAQGLRLDNADDVFDEFEEDIMEITENYLYNELENNV